MLSLRESFFVSIASAILFAAGPQIAPDHSQADSPVPKECAGADFAKLGRPVIFRVDGGLSYGLSAGSGKITFGNPVLLYFWIINTSNKAMGQSLCALDLLPSHGLTILDAAGQRVLSRREREGDRLGNPPCLRERLLEVSAHNCGPLSKIDLAELYVLPPGQYVVRFLDGSRLAAKFTPAGSADGVSITIEPK